MALGFRFNTRSSDRDDMSDARRIEMVTTTVDDAIAGAIKERDGLQRRMDQSYAQAVNLLENSLPYGARDADQEQSINAAETAAADARSRIRNLDRQIENLTKIRTLATEIAGDG